MVNVCKLTGKTGKFVKSHLIPQALTLPEFKGSALLQAGEGTHLSKRWTSWYDQKLVTQDGEDVLSSIDSKGIAELRRLKLVWSGWGNQVVLTEDHTLIPGTNWGHRELFDVNSAVLRHFFVSLLWRSAASSRWEFKKIALCAKELELLRSITNGEREDNPCIMPCELMQLSTKGIIHNHTPFLDKKMVPSFSGGTDEIAIPIIRFYFDGLIVHFHYKETKGKKLRDFGPLIVGGTTKLVVPTIPFNDSLQQLIIDDIVASVHDSNF